MTNLDDFQLLLRRSAELHEALGTVLADAEIDDSAHALMTLSTSMIAVKHGVSICVLAEAGNLSSANVLLRSQFETLVRALWLCFAATDEWFDKYRAAAQTNPKKDPNNSPGMDDMLKAISAKATTLDRATVDRPQGRRLGPVRLVRSRGHASYRNATCRFRSEHRDRYRP